MIRSRSGNGANADFMALIVSHSKSSRPQPNASWSWVISLVIDVSLISRLSVLTRDPEAQPAQHADRVLGDRGAHAGVDVRGRAQLEADRGGRGRTRRAGRAAPSPGVAGDVVDDADAVAEPRRRRSTGAPPRSTAGRTPRRRGSSSGSSRASRTGTRRGGVTAGSRPRRRRCRTRRRRGRGWRRPVRRSRGCARRCASPSRSCRS